AYPLVLLDVLREMVTNVEEPTQTQAPLNQLIHDRALATPELDSLTRPNVDTLYSQAYLDLGEEPYLLYKPATERYCSIQPFDGYSNTPAVLGTGGLGGNEEATYALTGPRFDGTLPDGVVHVPMTTDLVWLLLRIRCYGPDDVSEPHRIQDGLDIYPLSQHGSEHTYPRGTHDPASDYVPVERMRAMSAAEYFSRFNQLAIRNPGAELDRPALERFATLGIGPGLIFDRDALPEAARERADTIPGFIGSPEVNKGRRITTVAGWIYLDRDVGNYGTNYLYRAVVAHRGFANPVDVTAYPSTQVDANGDQLVGSTSYRMHFEPGQLPPFLEHGWWSLTAYTIGGRLIPNEVNRYAIDDSQDLKVNDDGSVDLWISAENPGPERERNWLPVCSEEFALTLRIYFPHASVTEHQWTVPQVAPLASL
ncbi:MAG: DUF1214 domain-containing protein, partial [Micrococcales bacterium]|nr:DUF1214 domain-containing protein [Micrococcales bacterium]